MDEVLTKLRNLAITMTRGPEEQCRGNGALTIVDQGVISSDSSRGAFMPALTPLPDVTWLACQHVGEGLGTPDNHIERLRSTDQGKSWSNQGSIHGGKQPRDGWAYRGPQISAVPDGRLVMTATRFESNGLLFNTESEALQRPEMLLFWSENLGRTWSDPQVVPHGLPADCYTANGAGTMLQLAPDRWMYPFETWKPDGHDGPPDQKAGALFSRDKGKSWSELVVVADDPSGARQLPGGAHADRLREAGRNVLARRRSAHLFLVYGAGDHAHEVGAVVVVLNR